MNSHYYAPDRETGFGHAVYRKAEDGGPTAEKVKGGLTAKEADELAKALNAEEGLSNG